MNASREGATVFLTGGTGFVGGHIARRLRARGFGVRALVREPARARELEELGAELVRGDVTDASKLSYDMMRGCAAVIHLVGIIREKPPEATFEAVHVRGTDNVVGAARGAGAGKLVFMSALDARPGGSDYHRTKHEAEEIVRGSSIPHVIFRPSIIVGAGADFLRLLKTALRLTPIMPIVGDGNYRLQPVYVGDVAEAFVQAVERDDIRDRHFELGGPHKLTFNRIIDIVCEEEDVRRRRVHVPVGLVKPLVHAASSLGVPIPITSDQLRMLLEENIVPGQGNVLRDVFGIEPVSLRTALQEDREESMSGPERGSRRAGG
jgi:NADH dehydrogenase